MSILVNIPLVIVSVISESLSGPNKDKIVAITALVNAIIIIGI